MRTELETIGPVIERTPIRSRSEWLSLRQRDVTASVAGALLGVHPYVTTYGLWAAKSGRLQEDLEETAAMRRGRLLEPVAVQLLLEQRPDWIIDDYPVGLYFRDPAARIGATPDLMVRDGHGTPGAIQIKTVESGVFRRTWLDEDGNVAPPLWIAVQAIVEAYLTRSEWTAVAAMVVGYGLDLHIIDIPIHTGIIDRLKAEVAAFWRAVESGQPPDPDYAADGKLLEQLHAGTGDVIDLTGDNMVVALADERAKLSADHKSAENRIMEIKAEMLAKLAGASAGRLADGRLIVANRVNRKAYSVKTTSYVAVTVKEAAR